MNVDKDECSTYNIVLHLDYKTNKLLEYIPIINTIYKKKIGNEVYNEIIDILNITFRGDDINITPISINKCYGVEIIKNGHNILYISLYSLLYGINIKSIHILFDGEYSRHVARFINNLAYTGTISLSNEYDISDTPIQMLLEEIKYKFKLRGGV